MMKLQVRKYDARSKEEEAEEAKELKQFIHDSLNILKQPKNNYSITNYHF